MRRNLCIRARGIRGVGEGGSKRQDVGLGCTTHEAVGPGAAQPVYKSKGDQGSGCGWEQETRCRFGLHYTRRSRAGCSATCVEQDRSGNSAMPVSRDCTTRHRSGPGATQPMCNQGKGARLNTNTPLSTWSRHPPPSPSAFPLIGPPCFRDDAIHYSAYRVLHVLQAQVHTATPPRSRLGAWLPMLLGSTL